MREPGVASISLRPSATYRITTDLRPRRPALVAGDVGGSEPQAVRALRQRLALPRPEPVDRPLGLAPLLEHGTDAVDVERDPRRLVDAVPHDDAVGTRGRRRARRPAGASRVIVTRGGVVSTLIGFGSTIVRCWRSSLTRGLVRGPPATTRPRRRGRSRRRRQRPRRSLVPREVPDDVAVAVDHVDVEPVALAQPERDHGRVRVALADGREDLRSPSSRGSGSASASATPCRRRRAPWQRAAPRRGRLARIWPRPQRF